MSSLPPREPSTRIASPWPTSITETRGTLPGRLMTTAPPMTTLTASRTTAGRMARDTGAVARRATGRDATAGTDGDAPKAPRDRP